LKKAGSRVITKKFGISKSSIGPLLDGRFQRHFIRQRGPIHRRQGVRRWQPPP